MLRMGFLVWYSNIGVACCWQMALIWIDLMLGMAFEFDLTTLKWDVWRCHSQANFWIVRWTGFPLNAHTRVMFGSESCM